jgi:hypothetical protein
VTLAASQQHLVDILACTLAQRDNRSEVTPLRRQKGQSD